MARAELDLGGLDALIAGVASVPAHVEAALDEVGEVVVANAAKAIAAQVGPDGAAWPATRDGRVALKNAAKSLGVKRSGTTLVVMLHGIDARHHIGWVKGARKRPILPTGDDPSIGEAFSASLAKRLPPVLGGAA